MGQVVGGGLRLKHLQALLDQGAELGKHRRQFGHRAGQLVTAQQAVAGLLPQRHAAQLGAHLLQLLALLGGDFFQGQDFLQVEARDQLRDQLFGAPLQHQQV